MTYLGAKITSDGRLDKEMKVRIHISTGAFNQLKNVWKTKNCGVSVKIQI